MKTLIDSIKLLILHIALIPHIFVISHRFHKKKTNIFADRPDWVIKILGAKRIDDDFFDEDDSEESRDRFYKLINMTCIEYTRRFR